MILRPEIPSNSLVITSLLSTNVVTGGIMDVRFHRMRNIWRVSRTVIVPLCSARNDVMSVGVPVIFTGTHTMCLSVWEYYVSKVGDVVLY